jgi:hypothetical protein
VFSGEPCCVEVIVLCMSEPLLRLVRAMAPFGKAYTFKLLMLNCTQIFFLYLGVNCMEVYKTQE